MESLLSRCWSRTEWSIDEQLKKGKKEDIRRRRRRRRRRRKESKKKNPSHLELKI